MMKSNDKLEFVHDCEELFVRCPGNQIEIPDVGSVELFDMPLIGFTSAEDKLFEKYKENEVVGPMFLSPKQWLPGAKTVAALFFPFTQAVRDSNRETPDHPSVAGSAL